MAGIGAARFLVFGNCGISLSCVAGALSRYRELGGDMNLIPDYMESGKMEAPDMICGSTPCQAFSLAGWRQGLNDDRENLTLKFVDIVGTNDRIRARQGKRLSIVFWENVENVLTDKTNAFGCLISSFAGLDEVIVPPMGKWSPSGFLQGKKRKVAWRVWDAKYFGLPQQRRRLYVVAGDVSFRHENALFERRIHEFLLSFSLSHDILLPSSYVLLPF